jgi:transcriptional regulator GlxA family with amidase domain
VERAKALLAGTDLSLAEIAATVGLRSKRQFTAIFTAIAGISPGRFRDQLR